MVQIEKEPKTSCEWINKAIKDKDQLDNTYKKLIDSVQKEEREKLGEVVTIYGFSENTQNITRRIDRIASEEKGKVALLEMTKRELGCK